MFEPLVKRFLKVPSNQTLFGFQYHPHLIHFKAAQNSLKTHLNTKNLLEYRLQTFLWCFLWSTYVLYRRVTRNFSGQGRLLKIRALWWIFNLQHTKERPRREKFRIFFSYIRLKQHFKWEIKPKDDPSEGIFSQNQGTFL